MHGFATLHSVLILPFFKKLFILYWCIADEQFCDRTDSGIHTHVSALPQVGLSLVAQTVKNLPALLETWVWSQGWEDPLEKGMATHSFILAWRIPLREEPWWATAHGVAKSQTQLSDWDTKCTFSPYSPPIQAATQDWAVFPEPHSRSLLVIHFKYSSV